MPLKSNIKRVMVIGSGPIVIGQAAEFDYAGTQACRALKEEGLEVILVNSNPATIMTDNAMADKIYIEPLTLETVKRIIKKERPDSFFPHSAVRQVLHFLCSLQRKVSSINTEFSSSALIPKQSTRQRTDRCSRIQCLKSDSLLFRHSL